MGTGRIVCWREFGIPASYTIEVSFCGNGDNRESRLLKRAEGTVRDSLDNNVKIKPATGSSGAHGFDTQFASSLNSTSRRLTLDEVYPSYYCDTDADEVVNELLTSYQTATHYNKQDLLTLGYEVGIAIYHFANLTHSNLENELQLATVLDLKRRKQDKSGTLNLKSHSLKISPSTSKDDGLGAVAVGVENSSLLAGSVLRSPERRKRLESALRDVIVDGNNLDELSTELAATEDKDGSMIAGECCNKDESSLDENVVESSHVVLTPRSALVEKYKTSMVEYVEEAAISRSMMRPTVYGLEALQTLIRQYNNEFLLPDCATVNVGLRVKCEYSIRRWLGLDRELSDKGTSLSSLSVNVTDRLEGSVDGSESDPSADNVPTAKLLKNMGKFKDTNSLMTALRKV